MISRRKTVKKEWKQMAKNQPPQTKSQIQRQFHSHLSMGGYSKSDHNAPQIHSGIDTGGNRTDAFPTIEIEGGRCIPTCFQLPSVMIMNMPMKLSRVEDISILEEWRRDPFLLS